MGRDPSIPWTAADHSAVHHSGCSLLPKGLLLCFLSLEQRRFIVLSRRLSLLAAIVFVGAAVGFSLPVSAGDEWLPITPEELKVTSDPKAPGAPAITLYRQVDRDDSDPLRPHEYNYVRQKIFTEEGRKNADVRSEEHTSELQSLTNLVCRLLLEKKKQHARQQHTE